MPARWPADKERFLKENWGEMSIPEIAKKLNKSGSAVKQKAHKIGLKRHIHSGPEYITMSQLCKKIKMSYSYTVQKLIDKGMPVQEKKSIKKRYKIIYLKDFWQWAEKDKMRIDFSRVERGCLGPEPGWVDDKRRADALAKKYSRRPWTAEEDERLVNILDTYSCSYREVSIMLGRREAAIQGRMTDLGLKQRPLKADNHNPWSFEETQKLIDMYYKGYISELIAEEIPRSAKAINGKIERMVMAGELHPTRYKEGAHRPLLNKYVTSETREFVSSRPEKERSTMRKFATHLIQVLDKAGISPDEEGIHNFMRVWRGIYLGEGEMSEPELKSSATGYLEVEEAKDVK